MARRFRQTNRPRNNRFENHITIVFLDFRDYLVGVASVGSLTFYQLGISQGGVAGPAVTGVQLLNQIQPEKAEVVPERRKVQMIRQRGRRMIH